MGIDLTAAPIQVYHGIVKKKKKSLYPRTCEDCGEVKYIQFRHNSPMRWCRKCSKKHSKARFW